MAIYMTGHLRKSTTMIVLASPRLYSLGIIGAVLLICEEKLSRSYTLRSADYLSFQLQVSSYISFMHFTFATIFMFTKLHVSWICSCKLTVVTTSPSIVKVVH